MQGGGRKRPGLATAASLAELGEHVRAEVIGGAVVEKAAPSFEHGSEGYVVVASAGREERIRAEPFDAVELSVARLFGADD